MGRWSCKLQAVCQAHGTAAHAGSAAPQLPLALVTLGHQAKSQA